MTLFRCILVNATYADEATGKEDEPKKRAGYRASTGLFRLTFLAATVPGIVGFQKSGDALNNPDAARELFAYRWVGRSCISHFIDFVHGCRYASTSVGLVLILAVAASLVSSLRNIPVIRSQCVTLLMFYALMVWLFAKD